MAQEAKGEDPLRVEMHGGNQAVVVAGDVKDNHLPAAGHLNLICRTIHLPQRNEILELRGLDECQPSEQGRFRRRMLLRPLAYRRRFDDFHSLGQNVLSATIRQVKVIRPFSDG